ncbi:MAG: GlxA family transcriptional regulator [Rhizobiaceae bacterium]
MKARREADWAERCAIGFLLLPGFSLLSFSSAIEPLRIANKILGRNAFAYLCCSIDGRDAQASNGLIQRIDLCIDEIGEPDFLVICSSDGIEKVVLPASLRHAVRKFAHAGGLIGGVCTGAYALASLGLLKGRKCTVHWEYAGIFSEAFPDVELTSCLVQEDRTILTCAGGSAAFEMMINFVERIHGARLCAEVADIALHGTLRPLWEHQHDELRRRLASGNKILLRCVRLMGDNISEPLPLATISGEICASRRTIERIFRKHTGLTPLGYYRKIRVEFSHRLVKHTELPILEIAVASGFVSASHFSRCYRIRFGLSPIEMRRKSHATFDAAA